MHFDSSSFVIVTDVEKKLFDMVVLLKSEVLELQTNDQEFKEKIAELEDERLRLNLIREVEFELRDTSETFLNTKN